jgi:hypothetical protein
MDAHLSIAAIAALVGKRARARMLTSQMDGRAHAATELAYSAGVTPQTASSHLAMLLRERRLALERQSRHHHFRIAVGSDLALDGPLGPVVVGGPKSCWHPCDRRGCRERSALGGVCERTNSCPRTAPHAHLGHRALIIELVLHRVNREPHAGIKQSSRKAAMDSPRRIEMRGSRLGSYGRTAVARSPNYHPLAPLCDSAGRHQNVTSLGSSGGDKARRHLD